MSGAGDISRCVAFCGPSEKKKINTEGTKVGAQRAQSKTSHLAKVFGTQKARLRRRPLHMPVNSSAVTNQRRSVRYTDLLA